MIVLASNSPRRKQLLHLAGWNFQVIPVEVDEAIQIGEAARDYVLRLAREKAYKAASQALPASTVIAADTTVVLENRILGKPESPGEAFGMLEKLRKRPHQVFTGVAVLRTHDMKMVDGICVTDVFMRDYRAAEIRDYVETGDPLDKAGAYAIQHRGFDPVERLEGCYTNVVGLPLCTVTRLLRQVGVELPTEITAECEPDPHPDCRVARLVMHAGL
jgi:septum formation protein